MQTGRVGRPRLQCALLAIATVLMPIGAPALAASSPLTGQSMNLSSTSPSIVVKNGTLPSPVQVIVGNQPTTIHNGQSITPAEFLAVQQLLTTGAQTIVINSAGSAVGGTFRLPASSSQLASLTVPTGVTGISTSLLNVSGSLVDQGSLIGLGTNGSAKFTINAGGVNVGQGALLSTIAQANLSGLVSPNARVELNINSTGDIQNAGTISASGALNLNAAGSISNVGSAGGQGVMSGSSTNLYAGSGTITNSGSISATSGNVLLNTAVGTDLVVNSAGGQISANDGSISFRSSNYSQTAATSLTGGDLSADSINFNAGKGNLSVIADQLSGTVNVTAYNSLVSVNNGTLTLGTMNISGDPTFANTNSQGNVVLTENLNFPGQPLAILAAGSVLANPGVTLINTSDSTKVGGDIFIVAGATISSSGTTQTNTTTGDNDTEFTVFGFDTVNGGNVTLPFVNITTNTTHAGSRGGNITVVAQNGSGPSGLPGDIELGALTTSATDGNGGDVNIFGNHISTLGGIDTHAAGAASLLPASGKVDIECLAGSTVLVNTPLFIGGLLQGTNSGTFTNTGGTPIPGSTISIGDQVKNNGTIIANGVGTASPVTLHADGNVIVAGAVDAESTILNIGAQGGEGVFLTSNSGSVIVKGAIDTKAGFFDTGVTLSAGNTIEVADGINTVGVSGGGNVSATAVNLINIGFNLTSINPLPLTVQGGIVTGGGSVSLTTTGTGDIRVGSGISTVTDFGANTITISAGGTFRSDGELNASGVGSFGTPGTISITANGGNELTGIEVKGKILTNGGSGGDISISDPNGEIILRGAVDANGVTSNAGAVSISGGFDVNALAGVTSESAGGPGGNLQISSAHGMVTVNGALDAASTKGAAGGTITASAADGILVTGAVNSSGVTGGAVDITSATGLVDLKDGVNSNALAAVNVAGGSGGQITISAPGVEVTGNVTSDGGNSSGSTAGAGGTAGSITMNQGVSKVGFLDVSGFIAALGGNTTGAGKVPGSGGDVSLTFGTVQVAGVGSGSASVNTSPGTGGTNAGTPGTIAITTFGDQPVPTDFNLANPVADQYVLPGAYFQFGNATVNGVKGALVAGTEKIAAGTVSQPSTKTTTANYITVDPTTGTDSESVQFGVNSAGGFSQTFFTVTGTAQTGFTRNKATPAEALQLYQSTVFGVVADGFGLVPSGLNKGTASNLTDINGASPNFVDIEGSDFARPLTAFNIATGVSGNSDAVSVSVLQSHSAGTDSVQIQLPSTGQNVITGVFQAQDQDSGAYPKWLRIDSGAKLVVEPQGLVSSSVVGLLAFPGEALDLRVSNLVNNGMIAAGDVLVRNESSSLALDLNAGSSIAGDGSSTGRLILSAASGTTLTGTLSVVTPATGTLPSITNLNIQLYGSTVTVGSVNTTTFVSVGPTLSNAVYLEGAAKTNMTIGGSSAIDFGAGQFATGGTFLTCSTTNLTATGSSIFAGGKVELFTTSSSAIAALTNFTGFGNTEFVVDVGELTDEAHSTNHFSSNAEVLLQADGDVDLTNGTTTASAGSNLIVNSLTQTTGGEIGLNGTFSAGSPSTSGPIPGPNTSGVLKSYVKTAGSIFVSYAFGDIDIVNNTSMTSLGGTVSIVAGSKTNSAAQHVDLGSQTSFTANGGNVSILASGNIAGGTPSGGSDGNTFTALGLSTGGGGGIEVLSGTTTSQIVSALAHRPVGPVVPTLASLVSTGTSTLVQVSSLGTGTTGLAKGTINFSGSSTGTVNIDNASTNPTTVGFFQGVVLVNATGASSVTLNQASFTSIVPIAQTSLESDDVLVDTAEDEPLIQEAMLR